jgi:hypothetical protein
MLPPLTRRLVAVKENVYRTCCTVAALEDNVGAVSDVMELAAAGEAVSSPPTTRRAASHVIREVTVPSYLS